MNKIILNVLILAGLAACAFGTTPGREVKAGNQRYGQGSYVEALEHYKKAQQLAKQDKPSPHLLYNQANCFYKLDNLDQADRLYRDVARLSDNKHLARRAKYNLGNCHFNRGLKQEQTDLKKAIDELSTAAKYYRQAMDLDPKDKNAAHNIAVARKKIRELKKKLQQQQQQQQQQNKDDKNKQDKQNEQQQQQDKKDQQQQQEQQQSQNDKQQQEQQQSQNDKQQQVTPPDTTAREILEKERQRREQYMKMLKGRWKPVEKDW